MTKSHFYTFLFFLLPLLYYFSLPVSVGDLAWWTAYGRYLLSHGQLLTQDIYSVLPTSELVYPALLTPIYAGLDILGGLELVSVFHKFVYFLTLLLIYKNSLGKLQRPYSAGTLFWILVSFSGSAIYFIDRPALIVLFLLVAAYVMIEAEIEFDLKFFLKISGLLILWVNMHGSWPLLLAMLVWKMLFRKNSISQKAMLVGLLPVTLLNPFGYRIWPYMVQTAVLSKMRGIDEWNTLNFHDYYPQGIIFLLSVAIVLYAVRKKFQREMLSSPLFALLLLGFTAMRNTGLFHLVLLPFLFKYNFLKESQSPEPRKSLNIFILGIISLLCVLQLPWLKKFAPLPEQKKLVFDELAPIPFADAILQTGSQAAIFNDWEYGSYLLYRLPNKMLIDTRNIIYSTADFNRYTQVISGDPTWEDFMKQYNFGFILLNKKLRSSFIRQIESSANWKMILENENSILFQNKTVSRP